MAAAGRSTLATLTANAVELHYSRLLESLLISRRVQKDLALIAIHNVIERRCAGCEVNRIEPKHEVAVNVSKHHAVGTQGRGSDLITPCFQLFF